MKLVKIEGEIQGDGYVDEMPLFVWHLTGLLCKLNNFLGLLGGMILMSYRWDYGSERSWWESLISGVRMWWENGSWK